ncbi:MAG: O-antigen ligase family protein [Desulforhopalus sp.]|nr:O-antigen ligase family protein [Desulforhopalus sp.]
MRKLGQFRNMTKTAGVFCIVLCCFFIPFSTSLMGATASLAVVFWLLSGDVLTLPRLLQQNVSAFLAIALFLLLAIGVSYSAAPLSDALAFLKKYRELVYFAMVVSLFLANDGAAKLAEDSFVAGCIVLLFVSYGIFFSIIPSERFGHSIVYHITHSFFMAILAFWCLQRAFDSKQYIYFWLGIFVATSINLFYIAPGRTGMLVYLALVVLSVFQRLSLRKSVLAIFLVFLAIGIAFSTSSNFSNRVTEAIKEVKEYHASWSRTSLGMRLDWVRNGLELIEQKPAFGHGTGSFRIVQDKMLKKKRDHSLPTDNPHNEYILIAVQTGIVGLFLFVTLLASQFISTFKLQPQRRYLLQGVIVAVAVGCLMNSFLFDSHPGHFYAIISAILAVPAVKPTSLQFRR